MNRPECRLETGISCASDESGREDAPEPRAFFRTYRVYIRGGFKDRCILPPTKNEFILEVRINFVTAGERLDKYGLDRKFSTARKRPMRDAAQ